MWRILERKGKRDCKRFAFISDFSCQSCVPQSFPRAATMHHYCQCDCSYRLPSRYYPSFTSAREAEITGRTFLLEQTELQGTPKDCKGHWVPWLDTGLHIKESEILMVAWSKLNVNEFVRIWEVTWKQMLSRWEWREMWCAKTQGRNKTKMYGWLRAGRIRAGELLNWFIWNGEGTGEQHAHWQ